MVEELENRIRSARERLELLKKARSDLEKARHMAWEEAARARALREEVARESEDVERLQRPGIASLLAAITGEREERIRRERVAELEARLRLEAAEAAYAAKRAEMRILEERVGSLGNPELDLRSAQERMAEVLAAAGSPAGGRTLAIALEDGALAGLEREVEEARAAGRAAMEALGRVRDSLGKAASWGIYDVLGAGVLSGAAKHPHVEAARGRITTAIAALERFVGEVEDVVPRGVAPFRLDLGGAVSFGDWLLDGLVADIVAQSRVARSMTRSSEAIAAVRRSLEDLESRARTTADRRAALERERENLVGDGRGDGGSTGPTP